MVLYLHELNQSRKMLIIWTIAIALLLAICVFMFPSMKGRMDDIDDVFSSMGGFTDAFGLNKLNFGTLVGFYSIECGNILGLGGAIFASLLGASIISKEEHEHTAEFLLTNPVSRTSVLTSKLLAIVTNILIMNAFIYLASILSILMIKESIPFKEITLLHTSYLLLQLELGLICFGISSFIKSYSTGIGLGISLLLYFINILSNITSSAKFLKFFTPFSYCEAADVVTSLSIDFKYLGVGIFMALLLGALSYVIYLKRDIKA